MLVCAALVAIPGTAFAGGTVELSDAQTKYNEEGVRYVAEGEYQLAIHKFKASLTLGEANVTLLNLGRTLARMGRCTEAREVYDKVADAPAVSSPTPEEIASVLEKYRSELPETCPSVLSVACPEGATGVSIDGGDAVSCEAAATVEVEPGSHSVEAVGISASTDVEVAPEEWVEVELQPTVADETESGEEEGFVSTAVQPSGPSPLQTAGLVMAGVGGAALVTAAVLDGTWVSTQVDAFEGSGTQDDLDAATNAQNVNKIIIFSGAGLAVTGGVLWLLGRQPAETSLSLSWSGDAPTVSVRGTW
jgi:hypothetical protein